MSATSRPRAVAREVLQLGLMLGLLLAARSSLANHFVVPTGSMEYTLMPGDRVVVDMRAYGVRVPFTSVDLLPTGEPRPGDVAVFDSPEDGTRLIKRVVAVGGDHVQLSDGRLTVNGRALHGIGAADIEQFGQHVARLNLAHGGGPDIPGLRVPTGKVLLLGDARGNSLDGRFWGLVPVGELDGRAVAVYWRRGQGPVWKRL